MPPKKQNQRRKGRGGNRAGRGRNAFGARMRLAKSGIPQMSSGGFPVAARTSLAYTEAVAVSTTIIQRQSWSGNGPYDPNTTGTGAQPYNYDDFAQQYIRYRCTASSVEINLRLTANGSGVMVVVPVNSAGVTFGSFNSAASAPGAVMREFFTGLDLLLQTPNGSVKCRATTKSVLGEDQGDRFQSLNNTTPTDEWFWHVHIESFGGATISGWLTTRLIYDIHWMDRSPQGIDYHKKMAIHHAKKAKEGGVDEKSDQKNVAMDIEPDSPVMVNRPAGGGLPVITNSGTTLGSMVLRPPSLRDVKVERKTAR